MRFPRAFGARARRVARQHLARLPASQLHQIALGAAGREPGVCERMAKLVRVNASDARLRRSAFKDLAYSAEVIQEYRDTRDYPTIFTCLFGDEAARSVGYPPLGLSPRAGLALAHHEARQRGVAPEDVLLER